MIWHIVQGVNTIEELKKVIKAAIGWYHAWQENARIRFEQNYYPNHDRPPNFIVRFLYGIGFFLGDFVPLTLNLLEGIYRTIQRLLTFVSKLLIDASTGIVLVGTIIFSITHSIELLQNMGATGGQEYIGVLMFEVIFISSTATLTGMLMKGKKPSFSFGFVFSISGFAVGIFFVLWSNIAGMGSSMGGTTIGILTPLLLIISQGLVAYRYTDEEEDETKLTEIIQRNRLAIGDVKKAIEMYMSSQKVSGNREENLETSHPVSSHLETGGMEKPPTEKLETSKLENLETGEMENPPIENLETGDPEDSSKLETGELESPKLEKVKLEDQENLETGELENTDSKLETSYQKLEEKLEVETSNRKPEVLQAAVEKQRKPGSLKVSRLEKGKLEDRKTSNLEEGKLQAGELEKVKMETSKVENSKLEDQKPEAGGSKKLETGELEKLEDQKPETGGLEKLETSKLETGGSKKLETRKLEKPKLEKPESGELEGGKQETSKVENPEEEKFTKEDLKYFSREELEAMMGADPEDVAVQILERQGKLPGRDRLIRLTGCKEWPARQALKKLKKELKKNAS